MEALIHQIEESLEVIGIGFDVLGVVVICLGITIAFLRYFNLFPANPRMADMLDPYRRLKVDIGLALLLGLEILVAADIIKTVAVEPTLDSLTVLGLLVVIRTFLSWTLVLEIEGRWPWQKERASASEAEAAV